MAAANGPSFCAKTLPYEMLLAKLKPNSFISPHNSMQLIQSFVPKLLPKPRCGLFNRHFRTSIEPFLMPSHYVLKARAYSLNANEKAEIICDFTSTELNLRFSEGNRELIKSINFSWLRDNCSCENCLHPLTKQKIINPETLIEDIKPQSYSISNHKINIIWPEVTQEGASQHPSEYSLEWILNSLHTPIQQTSSSRDPFDARFPKSMWKGHELSKQDITYDFKDYMKNKAVFINALSTLNKHGICFLTGVECDQKSVTGVASKIGPIYDTFYGIDWDVKNDPKASNIAYTSLDLGLHMDLLYFESPPGIQLLHCLENEVTGGDSIFVDGLTALEILKKENPEHYATLSQVPVTFQYNNDGHHLEYRRSTIFEDQLGHHHLFYSPPFMGPLDIHKLPASDVAKFYSGFRSLSQIINRSDLVYKTRLLPGDLVLFNNRRVLHGRTAFYPLNRMRHFKGTYVGMDSFKDRLRTML